MSYDINFWRQPAGYDVSPEDTYSKLCAGEPDERLLKIPVDEILRELKSILPDFDATEKFPLAHTSLQEERQSGSVEPSWSARHFRFDIRGELEDAFNKIVPLMARFNCPLYDPQSDKRYATPDGTETIPVEPLVPLTAEQSAELEKMKEQLFASFGRKKKKQGCGPAVALFVSVVVATYAGWRTLI